MGMVDGGGLGEQQCAGEPDELCAGAEREQGEWDADGLGCGAGAGTGVEASAETERELEGKVLGQAASERTRAAVMAEFRNPRRRRRRRLGLVGGRLRWGQGMEGGMVRAAAVVKPVAQAE